jgi:hypothetical protein
MRRKLKGRGLALISANSIVLALVYLHEKPSCPGSQHDRVLDELRRLAASAACFADGGFEARDRRNQSLVTYSASYSRAYRSNAKRGLRKIRSFRCIVRSWRNLRCTHVSAETILCDAGSGNDSPLIFP